MRLRCFALLLPTILTTAGCPSRDKYGQMIVDRHGTAWVGWRDTAGQFNLWMSNY